MRQGLVSRITENLIERYNLDRKNFWKIAIEVKKSLDQGFPPEYLLESVEIYGLDLKIKEGVFIPREETEYFVDWLFKSPKRPKWLLNAFKNTQLAVDLGCGCGFIGIVASGYFPKVIGIDCSELAVEISKKNASILNIKNYVGIHSDLFSNNEVINYLKDKSWILLCNPPYVPDKDLTSVSKNRVEFEPKDAIFSGKQGLDTFIEIFKSFKNTGFPIVACFELDPRNVYLAGKIAQDYFQKVEILKDQFGVVRFLICGI